MDFTNLNHLKGTEVILDQEDQSGFQSIFGTIKWALDITLDTEISKTPSPEKGNTLSC